MKNSILFIYFMSVAFCYAQVDFVKHAELLISAKRALEQNETQNAFSFYDAAFKIHTDNTVADYLNASLCASKLKAHSAAQNFIIKAIEIKKAPKESLLKFSDNNAYQNNLNIILPNYDMHLNNYYSIKNTAVFHQVKELVHRDQTVRKLGDYYLGVSEKQQEKAFDAYLDAQAKKDTIALKKYKAILFPKTNKVYDAYNTKVMNYADSLNVAKLIKITKNYGWQKEAWLILWHQRGSYDQKNWVWNYFKPLINKEINEGKIEPFFWAMFEDITALRKTGKSIYGYHPGKVNPETVNANRKLVGLPELTKQEIINRNTRKDKGRVF